MSSRRWARAAAVAAVLSVAGCGFSTVDANQSQVCQQLAAWDPIINVMLTNTNPEGTNGQAKYAVAVYLAQTEQKRNEFSKGQQQLLDRVNQAMTEYQQALADKNNDTPMAENQTSLDSYQMNIIANYRTMLVNVGCPMPSYMMAFPSA